jgi:hypothetical protein
MSQDSMQTPRKVFLLWCATLGLVGAHYSTEQSTASPVFTPVPAFLQGASASAARQIDWPQARRFRLIPAEATGRLSTLDSTDRQTILKLNRIDAQHARRRWLVLPDSVGAELSYAPFPTDVESLAEIPKFIVVSRRVQAFGAYEYGHLVRWGPTSTGKRLTPTDSGLFFTNWKSRVAISTDDSTWVLNWYFNFIAMKGVAFHEYSMPGRPASHGCVRLLSVDAQWIYGWADQWRMTHPGRTPQLYGTPVLVMGDYEYNERAPWTALVDDPVTAQVSSLELEESVGPNLAIIAARTPTYAKPAAPTMAQANLIAAQSRGTW